MKLWIARSEDGDLTLHTELPTKGYSDYTRSWYYGCCGDNIELPEHIFPEVTFENSPMEVELKLIENI